MNFNSKPLQDRLSKYFDKKENKYQKWYNNLSDKHLFKKIIEYIRIKYRFSIKSRYYDFKLGIKSLYNWFPIIWKLRNWGYDGVYSVMQHQLYLSRKQFLKNQYIADIDIVARDMQLAINLLEKIKNEYYGLENYDYFDTDWNWISNEDNTYTIDFIHKNENFDEYFAKYKSSVRFVIKKMGYLPEKKELARLVAHHNQEKCDRIFWGLMRSRLQTFWD